MFLTLEGVEKPQCVRNCLLTRQKVSRHSIFELKLSLYVLASNRTRKQRSLSILQYFKSKSGEIERFIWRAVKEKTSRNQKRTKLVKSWKFHFPLKWGPEIGQIWRIWNPFKQSFFSEYYTFTPNSLTKQNFYTIPACSSNLNKFGESRLEKLWALVRDRRSHWEAYHKHFLAKKSPISKALFWVHKQCFTSSFLY